MCFPQLGMWASSLLCGPLGARPLTPASPCGCGSWVPCQGQVRRQSHSVGTQKNTLQSQREKRGAGHAQSPHGGLLFWYLSDLSHSQPLLPCADSAPRPYDCTAMLTPPCGPGRVCHTRRVCCPQALHWVSRGREEGPPLPLPVPQGRPVAAGREQETHGRPHAAPVPTVDHQFGATDIYRLNLLFLKLKDKMRWGSHGAASQLVTEAMTAGTAECPAQRQAPKAQGQRGSLGSRPSSATVSRLALRSLTCKVRADSPVWSAGWREPHGRTWYSA